MMMTIKILFFFFLGTTLLFSQETTVQKELLKKAKENYLSIRTNPEKSFKVANEIIKEAEQLNLKEAELYAIYTQCKYYEINKDFKNMIITAKLFNQKAVSLNDLRYQAIAKKQLFEAYFFSDLNDLAFEELQQGMRLINRSNPEDSLTIITKADFYVAYATYYAQKEDYENELKYIKLEGEEGIKILENAARQKFLYIHYSNLGIAFIKINKMDSAQYYLELSQSLNNGHARMDVDYSNLINLGKIANHKKNYNKAISFFKQAENITGYKHHLNIRLLYDNIIFSYKKLNEPDSVRSYEAKKDSLNLNISESKNRSLHYLLNENKIETKTYAVYVYLLSLFVFITLIITFIIIRKNKTLSRQEKTSQKYLENIRETQNNEDVIKLYEMLKKNDPAFIMCFNDSFPDFTKKLLNINPKLIQSEIEFCALLKLKIPTKDIAKYKFIEPKTVHNKKYLLRKKLRIPNDTDIYQWFDSI